MPASEDFKYWAFISYSHTDRRWGDWLHAALETYRVPKRLVGSEGRDGKVPCRLFPVFRDREELPTSSDLGGNLRTAIEQSRFLVVICSPRAAGSRWVNEEIRTFQRLGRANRVLALIVAGEPNASDGRPGFAPETECFPPALRFQADAAGELTTAPAEPIAADARPGKDGRHNARLKLIAGILGVNYDTLRQRERQRLRRRRLWAAGVAVMLACAFAGVWQWQAAKNRTAQAQAVRDRDALVARHTADVSEERGRQLLLAGDTVEAAKLLAAALNAAPDRIAVRVMLGAAERRNAGLASLLHDDSNEKVTGMALSPSGNRLVVIGGYGKSAALWDVPGGRLLRRITSPGGDVLPHADFSARGDKLLLAWRDGSVIQDVESGKETPLTEGSGNYHCFLGDGSRVLSVEDNDEAPAAFVVRDLKQGGNELRRFELGPGTPAGLWADRTGRTAVVGWRQAAPGPPDLSHRTDTVSLKWFEVDTGKVIADLPRNDKLFGADLGFELSPDGSRLLYLRPDGFYEVRSDSGAVLGTTLSAPKVPPAAHWSPDGAAIALTTLGVTTICDPTFDHSWWHDTFSHFCFDSAGKLLAYTIKGSVCVREAMTGKTLAVFEDRLGWPDLSLFPRDEILCFTPDGRYLLLAGSGSTVKVWDWRKTAPDLRVIGDQKGAACDAVIFSPDGRLFAAQSAKDGVSIRETSSARLLAEAAAKPEDGGAWSAAFRPDGVALLVSPLKPSAIAAGPAPNGADDRPPAYTAATVWDTAGGKLLARLTDDAVLGSGFATVRSPSLEEHIRVGWGRKGFVTVNFNVGRVVLWNPETYARAGEASIGPAYSELSPSPAGDRKLALSRDGTRFIVACDDGVARVFSLDGLQPLAQLTAAPSAKLAAVDLSADGARALTVDEAGHGAVWEVAGSRKILAPELPGVKCNETRLSADGQWLAAACGDASVRIWNVGKGDLRFGLRQEKPPGEGINGLGAAFGLGDRYVRSGFLDVQFDPHGDWVAAIDDGGMLCVWGLADGRQWLRWKINPESRNARLAVNGDGHILAVYGIDGAVRLVNIGSAK